MATLLDLHSTLRDLDPRCQRTGKQSAEVALSIAQARYAAAIESRDHKVLLAVTPDGEIGGMTMLVRTDFSMALDAPVVHVAQMCVRTTQRRRGVGRALMAAAASWAEDLGLGTVALSVLPGARETHRYYARLGFAPTIVLRTAAVATLRRTLGSDLARQPIQRRRPLMHVRTVRPRRPAESETLSPQA